MNTLRNSLAAICGLLVSSTCSQRASTQDINAQSRALDLITATADKICNIVQTAGNSHSLKVTGAVNAQLNGLIRNLAELGISGEGNYNANDYAGVIQQDLPTALRDNAACKTNVFNRLLPLMVKETDLKGNHSDTSCQLVKGTWYSQVTGMVIPMQQNGCSISSEFSFSDARGETYYHEIEGQAVGDKFEWSDKVTDPFGCISILYGKYSAIEERQMVVHVERGSGGCGNSPTFSSIQTWVKR